MFLILRLVRFAGQGMFVAIILAWIGSPTYLTLDQRIEFNRLFGRELAAMTGLPALDGLNYARVTAREVRRARAANERAQREMVANARRAERPDRGEIAVEEVLQRLRPGGSGSGLNVSQGAKFVRVGE